MDDNADDKVVDMLGRPVNLTPKEEGLIEMREAAIEQLLEIVQDFRVGKMNGFAMVFTVSDGGGGSVMSQEVDYIPVEFLGSLERLKYRIQILMDHNEGLHDED